MRNQYDAPDGGDHDQDSHFPDDMSKDYGLQLDLKVMQKGSDHQSNHEGLSDDAPSGEMSMSRAKKVKARKRKGPRAQTIEEVFATISTVRSSGLNPPPERIVLTPRSAEACLRCGVNPETLKIRDLESFYDPDVAPAVQRMRHEAYSMRRHEEMKAIRHDKKNILAAEDAGSSSPPTNVSPLQQGRQKAKGEQSAHSSPEKVDSLSLLDIERRRMEKVRLRQERELEQMLDFEMKMSKIQEEANDRIERERRLNEQRERERMRYAQELSEEKRLREIKKKAQLDAEEERRKLVATEMAQRDRELAEQKAKQDRLRRIEAREREEERKRKAEEHRKASELALKQQQEEISERLNDLALAERARNEMLEQQRIERAKEMDERRRIVSLRIRKNLKQSKKLELQRKREITRKQEESEKLRQEHEAEMDRQRELAHRQQQMMERKRQMVLDEARREEERKKEILLQRQREVEQNVQHVQDTQSHQLALKKEYRRIQHQLKLDKVERMKRIQEYKRVETLRKMQETEQRTEAMLSEKDELIKRRKQLAVRSKIQRDLIMRTMENVKITKKWNQASKTIEKVMGKSSSRSPSPTRSINGYSRPKSGSSITRQTSLPNISRPHTPTAGLSHSKQSQSSVFRPPSPPPTRTAFKFTKEAQEAATTGGSSVQPYYSPYDRVPDLLRRQKNKSHVTRSAAFE